MLVVAVAIAFAGASPALAHTCRTLSTPSLSEEALWRSVNDDVMGGRSEGGSKFTETSMVFSGSINTNGGGFSSMRRVLRDALATSDTRLDVDVKGDGRAYNIRFDVKEPEWRVSLSFQALLTDAAHDEMTTVSVPLDQLRASFRGRRITDAVFNPDAVLRIGVIIADGEDGPFTLELGEIRACSGKAAN
ncbi:MAG: CIA30 family protein [Pseudomonadota bacterium]